MPTYDYKCTKCGHRFEGFAGMNDPCPPCSLLNTPVREGTTDEPLEAELCGGETVKVITSVAAHFVGGGWAADGYSKK